MFTSEVWPCLQILPMTCESFDGFQSGSIIIIVLAVTNVKPVPPALPDNNNTVFSL